MVLNETLRNKIDEVARRRKNTDYLDAAARGLLGLGVVFAVTRTLLGLLTGGQGGPVALALALAAGVTYGLTAPRRKHTRLTAARFIDHHLHLEDRLATAVEKATFDNTSTNRVEHWLFIDAANQAPFIKPDELVPYQWPKGSRWLALLLAVGIILSLPIYPRGLTWQIGGAQLQQVAKRADELLALAQQLERMSAQQPELKQVARDLRQVSEQLRSKRLPQDAALDLLRALEQEMPASVAGTAGASQGDIDISQIQNLAQRLRRIEDPGLFSSLTKRSQSVRNSDLPGQYADADGNWPDDGTGSSAKQPGNNQSARNNFDSGSDGQYADESESSAGSSQSGGQTAGNKPGANSRPTSQSGDDGNSTDSAGENNENGDSPGAAGAGGSQAGTEKGNNAGQSNYQRQTALNRELATIPGQINSNGKLFSGSAQGNTPPTQAAQRRPAGKAPAITPKSVEQAIEQESIPLAYRRWVKNYFAALEPGSKK